ncbi:MAG: hypothetical protein KKA07_15010 [Bacteroidetes bacterium]|nr:hypothetical protein [Bacteroidota bacterium]MBU1720371.1 hypothetical protein [Bacteroidota bacterium]
MKKALIIVLLGIIAVPVFSQNWELYSTTTDLTIEYQYVSCNDEPNGKFMERVIFRYKNISDTPISFLPDISCKYKNGSKEYETKPEGEVGEISLAPGEVLEGKCTSKERYLSVYSKMTNLEASILQSFTIEVKSVKTN